MPWAEKGMEDFLTEKAYNSAVWEAAFLLLQQVRT